MSNLLNLRQKSNLTQEELSEQSGVSVRTIQRIESGNPPKGYTLKALAKTLEVSEAILLEDNKITHPTDHKWLKIINLSSLPFILVPPLNIVVPIVIMFVKKEFTPVTRKIVSIQILWTLLAVILLLINFSLTDWFGIRSNYLILIPLFWILLNGSVILRNAVEISKNKNPSITPNINIL